MLARKQTCEVSFFTFVFERHKSHNDDSSITGFMIDQRCRTQGGLSYVENKFKMHFWKEFTKFEIVKLHDFNYLEHHR